MIIFGLTGSIGMGKSEAARMLREIGIPVFDADATVHGLLGPGGAAVAAVGEAFPGVVRDGVVNRQALGELVFADVEALRRLEAILHPLVQAAEREFLHAARERGETRAVLEIPLLFETGAEERCDVTIVLSAPAAIQEKRVLARPGMTRERLAAICARQLADAEKRKRADFTVSTATSRESTLRQLAEIVRLASAPSAKKSKEK
jgi:dephospho-CoA kinase